MLLAGYPLYNSTFRLTDVIHNLKHPITGEKRPHVVTQLPSFGEDRLYNKEQELIELVQDRLKNNRPVVIYARQTATKDIQPRIESIIQDNVPQAKTYVLRNTVSAERRERVIEQQVQAGVNVLVCNPELVKTGLDLIAFSTLIFYEIVFNLSTLLQAASRSYRLNQDAEECEVIYMFYQGTMEHTAVQLMSRKQRAAKILTGDTGLTGLDALTEGEAGFESALLNAITGDDELIDPRDLFKQDVVEDEITAEDNAFWNVDVDANVITPEIDFNIYHPEDDIAPVTNLMPTSTIVHTQASGIVDEDELDAILARESASNPPVFTELETGLVSEGELADILASIPTEPSSSTHSDPLVQFAVEELGGVLVDEVNLLQQTPQLDRQSRYVMQYLETISYAKPDRLRKYLPRLLTLIREGEWDDKEDVKQVAGILEDYFADSDPMQKRLLSRVSSWLKEKKLISGEQVGDIAQRIIDLSLMAFDLKPLQLDIFERMRLAQKDSRSQQILIKPPTSKPKKKRKRKAKLDLMAVPDDLDSPNEQAGIPLEDVDSSIPRQLAMFS